MDRGFVFARIYCATWRHPQFAISYGTSSRRATGNQQRREVFFSSRPNLKGRDVLVLDAVMDSGVMQEFCCGAWPKLAAIFAAGGSAGQTGGAASRAGAGLLWVSDRI